MVDTFREGDRQVGTRVDMGDGRSAFIASARLVDANNNPVGGASGPQPAASSQSVTPASNGEAFPVAVRAYRTGVAPSLAVFEGMLQAPGDPNPYALSVIPRLYTGNGNDTVAAPGSLAGAYVIGKGGVGISTGQVAVGTTATQVVPARAGRQKVTITPTTSTVFYVGAAGITTGTGMYVAAGGAVTLDTAAAVFAVGASAFTASYVELF
jgi:hypothetical protein